MSRAPRSSRTSPDPPRATCASTSVPTSRSNYQRLVAQLYAITLDSGRGAHGGAGRLLAGLATWATVSRMPDSGGWVRRVAVRSTIRSWRRLRLRSTAPRRAGSGHAAPGPCSRRCAGCPPPSGGAWCCTTWRGAPVQGDRRRRRGLGGHHRGPARAGAEGRQRRPLGTRGVRRPDRAGDLDVGWDAGWQDDPISDPFGPTAPGDGYDGWTPDREDPRRPARRRGGPAVTGAHNRLSDAFHRLDDELSSGSPAALRRRRDRRARARSTARAPRPPSPCSSVGALGGVTAVAHAGVRPAAVAEAVVAAPRRDHRPRHDHHPAPAVAPPPRSPPPAAEPAVPRRTRVIVPATRPRVVAAGRGAAGGRDHRAPDQGGQPRPADHQAAEDPEEQRLRARRRRQGTSPRRPGVVRPARRERGRRHPGPRGDLTWCVRAGAPVEGDAEPARARRPGRGRARRSRPAPGRCGAWPPPRSPGSSRPSATAATNSSTSTTSASAPVRTTMSR